MGVSKVVFGNDTVMDITDSTVTSNNLLNGKIAYGANGNRVVGSVIVPTVNNSTITIKENGSTVDSFTLNQSSNKTIDIPVNQSYYGTCTDAGTVVNKTVTVSNQNFKLVAGALINVKFDNANSATYVTLNVNGTGDKSIWYNGNVYEGSSGNVCGYTNRITTYVYDGTYWVWVTTGVVIDSNTHRPINVNGTQLLGNNTTAVNFKNGTNTTVVGSGSDIQINATDTNTTYTFAEGTTDGTFKVTPSGGTAQSVTIHGLKSCAYTESTDYATSSHTHGNIQNNGTLQTNDITIASGDKIVVTDASDSNKVARTSITFDRSTKTKALTPYGSWESFAKASDITNAINALDGGTISGSPSASRTLTAFSQQDGNVNATFADIAIANTQVSGLGTASTKNVPTSGNASTTQVVMGNDTRLTNARTPTSHTHGNITNDGKVSSDVTIANGDKLLITDASDSNKVVTSSITFNGSTATQCLTRKGTWATFSNNSGTVTSVTINATSPIVVDDSTAITGSGTRTISHATSGVTANTYGDSGNQTPNYGGTFKVPTITVNDTGHVTGISTHTVKIPASDNTDERAKQTEITTTGWRDIAIANSTSTAEQITGLNKTAGLSMQMNKLATTSAQGNIVFAIGSSHDLDTGNRYKGYLDIYNNGARSRIKSDVTSDATVILQNASGTVAFTTDITNAINALDGGTITGTPSASRTITALSESNGNISATFSDISITKSQVSDLAVVDATNDGLCPHFDDTSTSKFLRQDGTWAINSIRQNINGSDNKNFPILFSVRETSDTTTTRYATTYRNNNFYYNPAMNYLVMLGAGTNGRQITFSPNENAVYFGSVVNGARVYAGVSGDFQLYSSVDGDYGVKLGLYESGSSLGWAFCPAVNNKLRLGSPSLKWTMVYAINGTINTSDRNEKENIEELDEFSKDFIMDLKPVSYKRIEGDRTHYGLIAQEVEETLDKFDLTSMDFGGLCKDVVEEDGEEKTIYGLRYTEFIAPLIKTVQLQQQEIEQLKQRIEILEGGQGA